jgi:hypothetical protein
MSKFYYDNFIQHHIYTYINEHAYIIPSGGSYSNDDDFIFDHDFYHETLHGPKSGIYINAYI